MSHRRVSEFFASFLRIIGFVGLSLDEYKAAKSLEYRQKNPG